MKNGVILMTALVPTIGHQFLVASAANFMRNVGGILHVIISGRSFEPVTINDRIMAFDKQFPLSEYPNIRFHSHVDDHAPQNDDGTPDFWAYWANVVHFMSNANAIDYVFASEIYGAKMAEVLESQFIPVDIERTTYNISGTLVRENIRHYWDYIMPSMKSKLIKKITFFGAESVGKTTLSKYCAEYYHMTWLHEWARPYLETVGTEITEEKMYNIAAMQYSQQKVVYDAAVRPTVIQDTDLLSTIGYLKINGMNVSKNLINMFNETKSDLYVMLSSDIPFVEDQLRYGIDKRESNDKFWIDLLKEYGCNYKLINNNDFKQRKDSSTVRIYHEVMNPWPKIRNFVRD